MPATRKIAASFYSNIILATPHSPKFTGYPRLYFFPKLALQRLAERVTELEKDKTDAAALQEQLAHARDRNIRLQQQIDEDPGKTSLRQAPDVQGMSLEGLKVCTSCDSFWCLSYALL